MKKEIQLNRYIDHTNLKPDASDEDIKKLCREAIEYNFKSVCVNPSKINLCVEMLKNTEILICTVVGFPLGQNTTITKIAETIDAIRIGANEIDMVINISELKKFNTNYCVKEINEIVNASQGRVVKVIVETALLNEEEKRFAFEVVNKSNANFIKTSTGFASKGAEIEDIEMWNQMRDISNSNLLIKAAGGISTYEELIMMILAGADRIGTSRSVNLLKGNDSKVEVESITQYRLSNKVTLEKKETKQNKTKKENKDQY